MVTFIESHGQRGGQAGFLTSIVGAMDPAEVHGVIALQDGDALPALAATGARVWVLPTPGTAGIPLTVARLRRLLSAQRAELVHANGTKAALCAALATVGTGIPVVWMRYDGSFDGAVARAVARSCSAVVGISEAVLGTFDGLDGVAFHLVPLGVPGYRIDRSEAAQALRRELRAESDALVVIQAGRIVPNKGQLEAVAAIRAVVARYPSARLVFVGDPDPATPEHRRDVQERARELGVEAAVSFLGHRDDAVRLIAGADVLVAPSLRLPGFHGWREGFGLVVAEAMAVGTPVVAYDDAALSETLAGCGVTVPSSDRRALAAALVDLLGDPARREQLAAAGRTRAAELSFDRSLEGLSRVYESVSGR